MANLDWAYRFRGPQPGRLKARRLFLYAAIAVVAALGIAAILHTLVTRQHALVTGTAAPKAETVQIRGSGDRADDPAIWIHPTDPSLSTVIGTNKSPGARGGLHVYNLDGSEIQFVQDGKTNNVDLRYRFRLQGSPTALVAASNQYANTIALYRVNPATRRLENAAARPIVSDVKVHGLCMYRSFRTGKFYAFVTSKSGRIDEWELFESAPGLVDGRLVRSFDAGERTEGCVADDVLGYLYVSEQDVGIWKYGAEPDAGPERLSVDTVEPSGNLEADVEGLAIYYAGPSDGYLIASSQGSSTFAVYRRARNNHFLGMFRIQAGVGVDEVTVTDGLDVTNVPLGRSFSRGLLVVHDQTNSEGSASNYKFVPWEAVAMALTPRLRVDTTAWDPRRTRTQSAKAVTR
jgi:3-phytase